MLSIGKLGGGKIHYYLSLARGEYYRSEEAGQSRWIGQGAQNLGLSGTVGKDALERLYAGQSPTGDRPLVQNAGSEERRPGFDLTFSAPKSVSVLWAALPEDQAEGVRQAHERAVDSAVRFLERTALFTRRGRGGKHLERARGLVGAAFTHRTSRDEDMQLHTHVLVLNVAEGQDRKWATLDGRTLYDMKMAAGAFYRAALASGLKEDFGWSFRASKNGTFEVEGVPDSVLRHFSKRRLEIERRMKDEGGSSQADAQRIALESRAKKTARTDAELRSSWASELRALSFNIASVRQNPAQQEPEAKTLDQLVRGAETALLSRESYYQASELSALSFAASSRLGAKTEDVQKAIERHLARGDSVKIRETPQSTWYTTKEVLQAEAKLLSIAEGLTQNAHRYAPSARNLERSLTASSLSTEQEKALRSITRESGSLALLSGLAGTGKTQLLKEARALWERAGLRVLGGAFSARASKELEAGSGIKSPTLDSLLHRARPRSLFQELAQNLSPKTILTSVSWDAPLKLTVRNRPLTLKPRLELTKKDVLVIDEAGMLDTARMLALLQAGKKAGAKIVLLGDERQLPSIGPGAPFGEFVKRFGGARLEEIRRQEAPWERAVVRELSEGKSRSALTQLAEAGRVHVKRTAPGVISSLISAWKEKAAQDLEGTRIFAPRRADVEALNARAQEVLRDMGRVRGRGLRAGNETFFAGDRVMFTKNDRVLGVTNGELGEVVRVGRLTKALSIRLKSGNTVELRSSELKNLSLAYAMTVHKGQGATVDWSFVLLGTRAQTRELSYVEASRAKKETHFFLTERAAGAGLANLAAQMQKSEAKRLATRIHEDELRRSRGRSFHA